MNPRSSYLRLSSCSQIPQSKGDRIIPSSPEDGLDRKTRDLSAGLGTQIKGGSFSELPWRRGCRLKYTGYQLTPVRTAVTKRTKDSGCWVGWGKDLYTLLVVGRVETGAPTNQNGASSETEI